MTSKLFLSVNVKYVTRPGKISAPDGSPIEHGEAFESGAGSGLWVYTASVQGQPIVKIQAVAQDRPGGTAVMNIDKTF